MSRDLANYVEKTLRDREPGHDFTHTMRVFKAAEKIGRQEGADMEVLLAAVLLHDIISYPKGSKKRTQSADDSAKLAEAILSSQGWKEDKIKQISYCIRVHSYSKNLVAETLEAKILQDADRLDALGAIGIARTFSVGGHERRMFYNIDDPFCRSDRKLQDTSWTIDHFKAKLLRLEDLMHTAAAKEEAKERTRFMRRFLAQMEKEITR